VEFVEIPAGKFWMGWESGPPCEGPRHPVLVDAFAVAKTPVTIAEYSRFIEATSAAPPPLWNDPRFNDPRQPVVGVTWLEAVAYCEWLTVETGETHRLPTEAEWEKAARGGLEGCRYPWGDRRPEDLFHEVALPLDRPPQVGFGPRNGFGLTDLSGSCYEWCMDWHGEMYYLVSPTLNPHGPLAGTRRASRGGAWRDQNPWSPVTRRSSLPPRLRRSDYGFRVVRLS
jgi:formylglycine-generating enzyme required for sulfatase activity